MNTWDDKREIDEFGWWPQISSAATVTLLIGFLMTFARDSSDARCQPPSLLQTRSPNLDTGLPI